MGAKNALLEELVYQLLVTHQHLLLKIYLNSSSLLQNGLFPCMVAVADSHIEDLLKECGKVSFPISGEKDSMLCKLLCEAAKLTLQSGH